MGGCSSGARAVAHQSEGRWFEVSGSRSVVPRATCQDTERCLPMYLSVHVCVYECLEKHVVMYTLKECCMSVCEWVNVACSVRSALRGQLD